MVRNCFVFRLAAFLRNQHQPFQFQPRQVQVHKIPNPRTRHTKCFTRKCCMHTYSNITGAREIFRSDLGKMGKIHSREVAEERAPPWIGYNKNGICRCRCESKTKKCQWHMCCTGVQYISTRLSNVSNFRNSRGNIFGRAEEQGTGKNGRVRGEQGA